jgi:hypothetical protein
MKKFPVLIGGRERTLKYKTDEAIYLKNRFAKPLLRLLREDVMGLDANSESTGNVDIEVQIAFLWQGLRHDNARLQEETVRRWIDERFESADKNMGPIIGPIWNAVFYSGILGYSLDVEAEAEKVKAAIDGPAPDSGEAGPKAEPTEGGG